jgi:putative hydrolase of the HAD superfamily
MSYTNIKAVIFDYGEVLCHRPSLDEFKRLADIFELDLESFSQLWEASRAAIDRGDLTPEEYWLNFASETRTKLDPNQIENLCRWEIEMWSEANLNMVDWVLNLGRAGIKTALLSNMPADLAAHVQKKFHWMEAFNFKTFSAHVGIVKPDPAIFEHTLQGMGVRPSESLFVDDRESNISAARALGIQAIQFRSIEQLRDDLEGIGFPILPSAAT